MEFRKRYRIICIVILSISLVLFLANIVRFLAITVESRNHTISVDAIEDISDNWIVQYKDGSSKTISLPYSEEIGKGSTIRISKVFDSSSISNKAMLFENNRNKIVIYCNEEKIFSVNSQKQMTNIIQVKNAFMANIPLQGTEYSTIDFYVTSIDSDTLEIPAMHMANSYTIVKEYVTQNIAVIMISFLLIIIGIVVAVISIITIINKVFDRRLFYILVTIFSIVAWAMCDSPVVHMVTSGSPEVIALISYMGLFILISGPISFMNASFDDKSVLLQLPMYLVLGNSLVQLALATFANIPLNTMVIYTHITISLSIILCTIFAVKKLKIEKGLPLGKKLLLLSIFELSITTAGSVVFYYAFGDIVYRISMSFSLLIFILLLLYIVFYEYSKKISYAGEKIRNLENDNLELRHDLLTGLRNRNFFDTDLQNFFNDKSIKPVLVELDLNRLKRVNDMHGHLTGDRYLQAFADCLKDTFPTTETRCYRIGGDEFALLSLTDEITLRDKMKDLNQFILKSEFTGTLTYADGYSSLYDSENKIRFETPEEWYKDCDKNMYDIKRRMHNEENLI